MRFCDAKNMDVALYHEIANRMELIFCQSFDIPRRCAQVGIAIVKRFLIDASGSMAILIHLGSICWSIKWRWHPYWPLLAPLAILRLLIASLHWTNNWSSAGSLNCVCHWPMKRTSSCWPWALTLTTWCPSVTRTRALVSKRVSNPCQPQESKRGFKPNRNFFSARIGNGKSRATQIFEEDKLSLAFDQVSTTRSRVAQVSNNNQSVPRISPFEYVRVGLAWQS